MRPVLKAIDNIESSFFQLLASSNLYAIRIFIDHNVIDFQLLNTLLQNNISHFKSQEIADYFINIGLDNYNTDTLKHFFTLYVNNKWSPDIIISLINTGIKLTDNINDVMNLPDDIFFDYVKDMKYAIDRKLILDCIKCGSKAKLDYYWDETFFDEVDYYYFIDHSNYWNNEYAYHLFINYVKDNHALLYCILLGVIVDDDCYYGAGTFLQDLVDRLDLTDSEILLCTLMTPYEHLKKVVINKYPHMKNKIDIKLQNTNQKFVDNLTELNTIYVHCKDSKLIDECLEQCDILLEQMQ